jgi:2-polyprenyl-6-methoxyphenol hydroxylase-like FAD-dependent oxidoreductase
MFNMKFTIVGAGIGGLTTAIALEQKGFEVEIFESFPEMKRMGAGLVLANNAMSVFQRLGLAETIYKNSNRISSLKLVDEKLDVLTEINMTSFEQKLGVHYAAIHRGTLQEILLKNLKSTKLHLGKRLKYIEEYKDTIHLHFEDGMSHEANILIGADGIHSVVRNLFFPKTEIRNAHQVCWRGITKMKLPAKFHHELNESWGKGTRFGIVPLKDGEVYWFALANYKNDFRTEFQEADLGEMFSDYDPIIAKIIHSTPTDKIIINEINDLKPIKKWHTNKVCLIGDAAHATTPNMGQGACQSIEDALALSVCLEKEKEKDIEKAFSNFQKLRIKKANGIINQSWQIGKMAQIENSFGRKIRNSIMKLTPDFLGEKQSAKIFELNF